MPEITGEVSVELNAVRGRTSRLRLTGDDRNLVRTLLGALQHVQKRDGQVATLSPRSNRSPVLFFEPVRPEIAEAAALLVQRCLEMLSL